MLDWTHNETGDCPDGDECRGKDTCEYFPTNGDRIAMARAAYEAYAEADGTDLVDFVQDVEMLARAEGLVQKVWVVTQHESDSDEAAIVKVVGDETAAKDYITEEEIKRDNAGVEGVWWEAHQYEVSDTDVSR